MVSRDWQVCECLFVVGTVELESSQLVFGDHGNCAAVVISPEHILRLAGSTANFFLSDFRHKGKTWPANTADCEGKYPARLPQHLQIMLEDAADFIRVDGSLGQRWYLLLQAHSAAR